MTGYRPLNVIDEAPYGSRLLYKARRDRDNACLHQPFRKRKGVDRAARVAPQFDMSRFPCIDKSSPFLRQAVAPPLNWLDQRAGWPAVALLVALLVACALLSGMAALLWCWEQGGHPQASGLSARIGFVSTLFWGGLALRFLFGSLHRPPAP